MITYSLGEFEELVLLVVAGLHDEAYGVSIHQELVKSASKDVSISAIHIVLNRMEEKGFVESRFGGITEERGGRRKKYYVITALGKRVLDTQFKIRVSLYNKIPKISFGR